MARRVSDGAMLALIKSWLEMAVEEDDGKGANKRKKSPSIKTAAGGTPQGAPISPLLANLSMRRFLLGLEANRLGQEATSAHRQLRRRFRDPLSREHRRERK